MNKKTLFIILSVVIILALGVGIYFWLRGSPAVTTAPNTSLPFGETASGTPLAPTTGGQQSTTVSNTGTIVPVTVTPSGLREITAGPVALGTTLFTRGSSTIVRYVEKSTGNVYEYDTLGNAPVRITNTTIPIIEEAAWGNGGNSLVLRFIKGSVIQSLLGSISTSSTSVTDGLSQLTGPYLPENITYVTFSPKKDKIFYLLPSSTGIAGFVADKAGSGAKSIWQFPTTEWLAQWVTDTSIALTTKASDGIPGELYTINASTGALSTILSDLPGLTTLSGPDGNSVLYSQSQNSITTLSTYNIKTGVSQDAPFTTLPEKCVWKNAAIFICGVPQGGMDGNQPDLWYQGVVSFNDTLWQGDTASAGEVVTANTHILNDLSGIPGGADVIAPIISPDGKTLVFENKKDMSLWLIPLPN